MKDIIISGINGKLGRLVYKRAKERNLNVVCGIDKSTVGDFDCPVYKSFDQVKLYANVIIDFSSPENLNGLLSFATNLQIPTVICTTGYTADDEKLIETASKHIPIFKSSNTSRGVTALKNLTEIAVNALKEYDVEIIETHHKDKVDSPSGTAKELLEITRSIKQSKPIYGRFGSRKHEPNEICVHSVRGGSIVGEHEIIFLGNGETLSIKHTAIDKVIFADGAIDAAEFIINKPNGLYGMNDVKRI